MEEHDVGGGGPEGYASLRAYPSKVTGGLQRGKGMQEPPHPCIPIYKINLKMDGILTSKQEHNSLSSIILRA